MKPVGIQNFGGLFAESTNTDLQPYLYTGKELDRMHGLDWHDYGARHYDAARIQWTTMDPLCEKYYHMSPYVFCGNNFVNAVDMDGQDYYVRMSKKDKTYTITADYHTGSNAGESAEKAVAYWNNLSGKYKFVNDGYTIKFNLTVIRDSKPVTNSKKPSNQNTYGLTNKIKSSKHNDGEQTGSTKNGNTIQVRTDKKDSDTGAHEVGHTLGLDHRETGIMTSNSNDELRSVNVNLIFDVHDIICNAIHQKTSDKVNQSNLGRGYLIIDE